MDMRWITAALALGLSFMAAAPALALDFGNNSQFSPNGNYFAAYSTEQAKVVVWNYSGWPASPVVREEIPVAVPLVATNARKWRVTDDGAVWIVNGNLVSQFTKDGSGTPRSKSVPMTDTLKLSVMGHGAKPAAIFVTTISDRYQEVRCALSEEFFAATDGSGCTRFSILASLPQVNAAYKQAYSDSFSAGVENLSGYGDYLVNHVFLAVLTPAELPNLWNGFYEVMLNGQSMASDSALQFPTQKRPARKTYALSPGGHYFIEIDGADTKLYKPSSKWSDPITVMGTKPAFSPDGRYVFTRRKNGPEGELMVRDLRQPFGSERTALLGGEQPLSVSPNGKFVLHHDPSLPVTLISLTDPFSGLSRKVVEDILMTRVTANLKAEKWSVALDAMTELESRGAEVGENFHFYQVDTLVKAGRKVEAQKKAADFLTRYGEKSQHYKRMIEILAL